MFDLKSELEEHAASGARLHSEYLNPQVPRMLRAIGFDRVFERGEGTALWDAEGQRYLDFLSGFGVHAVGRNHPVVRRALHDALEAGIADLVQFDTPVLSGLLAQRLLAVAPGMARVYFCNSGTEAVEAALKFARRATGRSRVLYASHAYHGLTLGSLSVNGGREFRVGFGPLLPDTMVEFGDLDSLQRELRRGDVAALLVEPVQGKGVQVAPPGYLAAAKAALEARGALLICDEVQTGLGRTGDWFAYEREGVIPDLVTVAKALSGGFVPVGATLARPGIFERVYSSLDRVFVHASTFAGNALAMTAGLATLAVIAEEGLIANARARGASLMSGLSEIAREQPMITQVRGRGLMIGIEFGAPRGVRGRLLFNALNLARRGLFAQLVVVPLFSRHRILTQVAADRMAVIKILPPLTVSEEEVQEFLTAFAEVMRDAARPNGLSLEFGRTLLTQALRK
ncbi:MAG: aspartate aminotransferase family protein [Mycobacteriales bacterium]